MVAVAKNRTVRDGVKLAVIVPLCGVLLVALLVGGIGLWGRLDGWLLNVHNFRQEIDFTFDGRAYTAVGSMQCSYRRAWFTPEIRGVGGTVMQGYDTSAMYEAPSAILADGKGAIVFEQTAGCPPLPELQDNRRQPKPNLAPAYYFPNREERAQIWMFEDRPGQSPGRFEVISRQAVAVKKPQPAALAQNAPAAWSWTEQLTARDARGGITRRAETTSIGFVACVLTEDEWRKRPDFVEAAHRSVKTVVVNLPEPGQSWQRNCPMQHLSQISLVPSEDFSTATLDLDHRDLYWTAILTPNVAAHRDNRTRRWAPELCVAGEGCTGMKLTQAVWIYLPNRYTFARVEVALPRNPIFVQRHRDGF